MCDDAIEMYGCVRRMGSLDARAEFQRAYAIIFARKSKSFCRCHTISRNPENRKSATPQISNPDNPDFRKNHPAIQQAEWNTRENNGTREKTTQLFNKRNVWRLLTCLCSEPSQALCHVGGVPAKDTLRGQGATIGPQ